MTETCTRCGAEYERDEMTPFLNDTWLCEGCLPAAEADLVREIASRKDPN